jgi:predicted secreted protein
VVYVSKKAKTLFLTIFLVSLLIFSYINGSGVSAASTGEFIRAFGGAKSDVAYRVIQTKDGGYALAGQTSSYGAGLTDAWLVKTDSNGNLEWNKTYGGPSDDTVSCIIQTSDSGFILSGLTFSFGSGGSDFWVIKTDSNGNAQWNKTYGGQKNDFASYIIKNVDGGYAVVGWETSFGSGGEDVWLIKIDANGNMQWNKTYGGLFNDEAFCVIQTSDGGYAITGDTASASNTEDAWFVKTDSNGNMQWNQTYGQTGIDAVLSVVQLNDDAYVLGGWTSSFGAGSTDAWLIKTTSNGSMLWNTTYGGLFDDTTYSMVKVDNGGFALAGSTRVSANASLDFWLVKADSNGELQFNKTYGEAFDDVAYSIIQTSDKAFVLTGETGVSANANKDALLVKTIPNQAIPESTLTQILPLIGVLAVILAIILLATIYVIRHRKTNRKITPANPT